MFVTAQATTFVCVAFLAMYAAVAPSTRFVVKAGSVQTCSWRCSTGASPPSGSRAASEPTRTASSVREAVRTVTENATGVALVEAVSAGCSPSASAETTFVAGSATATANGNATACVVPRTPNTPRSSFVASIVVVAVNVSTGFRASSPATKLVMVTVSRATVRVCGRRASPPFATAFVQATRSFVAQSVLPAST